MVATRTTPEGMASVRASTQTCHFAVGSAAHGVGDDFAVEQVQDRREVQFAVFSFEFGHVGQPFFVGFFGCEQTFEEVFRYFAHGGMAVDFFRPYFGFQP